MADPRTFRVPKEYELRTPVRQLPTYRASAVEADLRRYGAMLQGLTKGAGAYDFTARPTTWMDIQAQQVSATGAAREALAFNQAEMGTFQSMAKSLTEADVATRTSMLDQYVPEWRQQRDKAAAINDALMSGEIPKDVADQLKRSAAFTSVMGGGGAGTQRALTARDLGTTSLQLQQQGMQGAERWTTMMANLLPKQTSVMEVMATQGLTSQQALENAYRNAERALEAAKINVTGRTETALRVEEQRLKAEEQKRLADTAAAQIQATGFSSILNARLDLEKQKYNVASEASKIEAENIALVQPEYRTFAASGLSPGPNAAPYSGYFSRPFYDYSKVQSASQYGFGIR